MWLQLLLSLFITHLAVGGELLQYSTDDIIYVSADGIDDSSCLNGDGYCKTLGYVLTNIPMLQCSNCTVMVIYDHVVGLFNTYSPCTVNISNVDVLRIVGSEQPNLYFNHTAISLVNADNASVVLDNIIIHDCLHCVIIDVIRTENNLIFPYYLLQFNMTNTVLHNSFIQMVARSIYCQHIHVYSKYLDFAVPKFKGNSKVVVLNSTFHASDGIMLSAASDASLLAVVKNCRFIHNSRCFYLQQGLRSTISGNITFSNNFVMNSIFTGGITASKFSGENRVVTFINNTFINNKGNILCFHNWPHIEIRNSTFIRNSVIKYNDHLISIKFNNIYYDMSKINIVMHELNFSENRISMLAIANVSALVTLITKELDYTYTSLSCTLSCLNFSNNRGTSLSLVNFHVTVTGDIVFSDNIARIGGCMYIGGGNHRSSSTVLRVEDNATVNFTSNAATYGGAIYIDQDYCFVHDSYNDSFVFKNNHANYGPDMYSSYSWCACRSSGCRALQNTTSVVFLPTSISFNDDNRTTVFPGQAIEGEMKVSNCFGKASCLAQVFMLCDERVCTNYALEGPSTVSISNGTVSTGLTVTTSSSEISYNPQLRLQCKSSIEESNLFVLVNVTVLQCPAGFVFRNKTEQCECAMDNNEYFICLKSDGVCCIKRSYWYSNINHTVSPCIHLFCDFSNHREMCPSHISSISNNYILLGSTQDAQCLDGHGGTLCTGCAHNKLPTYGALQCIDSDRCASWHPYVLLLLTIAIPFLVGVFLIVIVRLKLSIGSGYLYGPLFYLAVLNLIPLTSYSTLNTIISLFVSTILLQLNALGYIPWCFFDSVNLLTSKWLKLVAPLVVGVVLLLTIYLARCSPKLFGLIQKSPLQAMCLLMYVSFWSLASTAISVIIPVHLSGVEGVRVHLQPDLAYLSGGHIPLWIISVMILLLLYSIVTALTFSRFFNFHRFKPFFDEFQSCYRDSYRWYKGIYFIVWTILLVLVLTSSYLIFQTFLIVLAVTHCLLQPYCKRWLNVMDGFFLGSLSVTACSVLGESSPYLSTNTVTTVLVYVSVMGPLCVISLGIVCIVLVRFGVLPRGTVIYEYLKKKKNQYSDAKIVSSCIITTSALGMEDPSDTGYREPLLCYVQDGASNYDAANN